MKVFTSYYGQYRKLRDAGIVPVSISIYPPKWFQDFHYLPLAPNRAMMKMTIPHYIPQMENILKGLNPKSVLAHLQNVSQGQDIALLCYEKPPDFCHRHMVGEWLSNYIEQDVKEWEAPKPRIYPTQMQMF